MRCFFKTISFYVIFTTLAQIVHGLRKPPRILHLKAEHELILNTEIGERFNREIKALMASREESSIFRTSCTSPSEKWLHEQTKSLSNEDLSNFFDWYLHVLPFAYKLYVENNEYDDEYFGVNGEYTTEIQSIHRRTEDFWTDSRVDGDVGKISLFCAHGSDLADREKLVQTLHLLFSDSNDESSIEDLADDIQELIQRLPGRYNYPLLTFNAFATDAIGPDEASIIIGDGYFQFQKDSGVESEGPEYAHTHEYSHHLQLLLGVGELNDDFSDQSAKKQELMADAFSAYFLAHDSGGDMTSEEISNLHAIAYSVGDCEVTNEAHHGTPSQRKCATVWGSSLADSDRGRKLKLQDVAKEFESWYTKIDEMDDSCDCPTKSSSAISGSLSTWLVTAAAANFIAILF